MTTRGDRVAGMPEMRHNAARPQGATTPAASDPPIVPLQREGADDIMSYPALAQNPMPRESAELSAPMPPTGGVA